MTYASFEARALSFGFASTCRAACLSGVPLDHCLIYAKYYAQCWDINR